MAGWMAGLGRRRRKLTRMAMETARAAALATSRGVETGWERRLGGSRRAVELR